MKTIPSAIVLLALAGLASLVSPAAAEMCTLDAVPAATLLLPYFEVDLDAGPGEGVDTVFTIHNALPAPTIAHLSFWTDWSQPVLDFDVFLTGYDAQTISLYQVLANGNLPVTADEQSDLMETAPVPGGDRANDPTSLCDGTDDSCSPHGSHPSWDGSFTGDGIPGFVVDCIQYLPFFVNPLLQSWRLAQVQDKLTGQSIDGGCYGADHGDGHARGYVTIDNANACSLIFPSDPGYFSDGVDPGLASNVNQLWGDWYLVDPLNNPWTVPADPLIHVEAEDGFTGSATGYTFYGRYTQPQGTADNREPLASAWAFGYRDSPAMGTSLVVWRDPTGVDIDQDGFACGSGPGTGPDWHPLGQIQVVCFDQIENGVEVCAGAECLPLESQRLALGDGDFDVPFAAGWCHLNLGVAGDEVSGDVDFPGDLAQSWVGATYGLVAAGGFSAVATSHACEVASSTVRLEIFADGFESGDTVSWSSTTSP